MNSGILRASAPTPYRSPRVSLEEGAEHTEQVREQTRQQITEPFITARVYLRAISSLPLSLLLQKQLELTSI